MTVVLNVGLLASMVLGTLRGRHSGIEGSDAVRNWRSSCSGAGLLALLAATVGWMVWRIPLLSDDFTHLPVPDDDGRLIESAFRSSAGVYYRPLPRMIWHVASRVGDPLAIVRAVMGLQLGAAAILLSSTLVRIGVSKLLSFASLALWMVSPCVMETMSWCSNLMSTSSLVLAACCLEFVSRSLRSTLWSIVAVWGLALCAMLCKEDTSALLLFGVPFASLWSHRSLRATVVNGAAVVGGIVTSAAVKFASLAATGRAEAFVAHVQAYWSGVWRLLSERPLLEGALSPDLTRETWLGSAAIGVQSVTIVVLLLVRQDRRVTAISLLLFIAGLAPCIRFSMFAGGNERLWFVGSLGLAIMSSSILLSLLRSKTTLIIACVAVLATEIVLSARRTGRWVNAGQELATRVSAMAPLLHLAPSGSRVLVYSMPDNVDGVVCFRNGGHIALQQASGREDIEIVGSWFLGLFDEALLFDRSTGKAWLDREALRSPIVIQSQRLVVDFSDSKWYGSALPCDSNMKIDNDGSILVTAGVHPPCVLLPWMRFEESDNKRIKVSGSGYIDHGTGTSGLAFAVVRESDGRIARSAYAGDTIVADFAPLEHFRIELVSSPLTTIRCRSITIEMVDY